MPEMTFTVRWPDGSVDDCYSPSLVIHDHLDVTSHYPVDEFVARTVAGLDEASERVRLRFGFACTSAAASKERIQQTASRFAPHQLVWVLRMHPPLPEETSA